MQARGELSSAQSHLDEAIRVFQTIGAKFELGRTYLTRADLSNAQKDSDCVRNCLAEARRLFDVLRTPKYVERTEQLAHTLGVNVTIRT